MDFPKEIFKAYDIRGFHHQVTPELAERVGAVLVERTGAKTVVVGYDMRETSPTLAQAAIKGITERGADVIAIGLCSTSLYNYAVARLPGVDAGLMVTASHNPTEYNGMKMALPNGRQISGVDVYEDVQNIDLSKQDRVGAVTEMNVLDDYIAFCLQRAKMPAIPEGMHIVADYGNGLGSITLPKIMERLGVQVTHLFDDPDDRFPNHEANPAKEETLEILKEKMKEVGSHFGVATDGDADRISFVSQKGFSLGGDVIAALLAPTISTAEHDSVVVTLDFGWASQELIQEAGMNIIQEKIGRTFVANRMIAENAVMGAERSGHIFYRDFGNFESVDFTFLLMLKRVIESRSSIDKLIQPLTKYASSGQINFEVEDKEAVLMRIRDAFEESASNVSDADGIRAEFDSDWWFIVRPSNTEPVIRLNVEAKTEAIMQQRLAQVRAVIEG